MSKGTSPSRKQSRSQFGSMGYLKVKNMFGRFSEEGQAWYNKMAENGKTVHEANTNRTLDNIENQLQTKLTSIKEVWIEMGHNAEEIKLLEEAWLLMNIKNKETFKQDKKEAKRLIKEAKESLNSRLDANN